MRRIMLLLALMSASTPAQGSTLLPGELFTPDSVFVVITAPVFADGTNRFCWHCDDGIPSNDLQLILGGPKPCSVSNTTRASATPKNSLLTSSTTRSLKTSASTAWSPTAAGRSSSRSRRTSSLKISANDRFDSTPNEADPHLVNYSVLLLLKL